MRGQLTSHKCNSRFPEKWLDEIEHRCKLGEDYRLLSRGFSLIVFAEVDLLEQLEQLANLGGVWRQIRILVRRQGLVTCFPGDLDAILTVLSIFVLCSQSLNDMTLVNAQREKRTTQYTRLGRAGIFCPSKHRVA
jgi:hypothetical protein